VSRDVTHAGDQADFDLDEDLFDFAGVAREVDASEPQEDIDELLDSFRAAPPAEDLLAVPAALAAAPAPHPTFAPLAPAAAQARAAEPTAAPTAAAATNAAAPRRGESLNEPARAARPSLSKSLLAIALSVTLLNAVLAVVVVRGRSSTAGVHLPDPVHRAESEREERRTLAAPPHVAKAPLPDPEAVDPAHAHPALDEARSEISRGEYASARQRVYGLLAIIDRLEDPRRGALEADCQFLIAQSLHLEALARMGGAQ
jgi:hypothetical protein